MRPVALAAAVLLLSSCSTLNLEMGDGVDPDRLERFAVGTTRRAEVLASLGPPTALAAHGDGVALLYEHVRLRERQLGLGMDEVGRMVGLSWLALIKLSLGRSAAHHEVVLLLFDSEAVLRGVSRGSWEEVFGRGAGVQFLFNVAQVVDSGTLRDDHPARIWGREALDPLPRALNRVRRADLELRGTGVEAGQKSPEMLDHRARKTR